MSTEAMELVRDFAADGGEDCTDWGSIDWMLRMADLHDRALALVNVEEETLP